MLNERENLGRWRLRVRAGALAFVFAAFSLLPWVHVLTPDLHAGHGCRGPATALSPGQHLPAMAAEAVGSADTCWVCQGLVTLLQHTDSVRDSAFIGDALSTSFFARAPHAPSIIRIDPASRSQAPPARA